MSDDQQNGTSLIPPCDELETLLPVYVMGMTTAEETARVEELLPLCPEAADEVAEYAALAEGLTMSVEPMPVEAQVKSSLLSAIAADAGADQPGNDEAANRQQDKIIAMPAPRTNLYVGWWVASAAIVLLLATNVYWLMQRSQQLNIIEQQNRLIATLRQDQSRLVNEVVDDNFHYVPVGSTTDEQQYATVVWDVAAVSGRLYTEGLPVLDTEQTYQLWLIDSSGAQSAGIFGVDSNGVGLHEFRLAKQLSNFDAIGISIEPASGSEQPTTDPLAVGEIPRS